MRSIMFLGVEPETKPEHLPLSVDTFGHVFEFCVSQLRKNQDGTISLFLDLKGLGIACNVVKFICMHKKNGVFVFVDFVDGVADDGIAYYARLDDIFKESDVHDTVRNPRVKVEGPTGSFEEIELVMTPDKVCKLKDNISDFTMESIRTTFGFIAKCNTRLHTAKGAAREYYGHLNEAEVK